MQIAVRTSKNLLKEIKEFIQKKGWSIVEHLIAKEYGSENGNEHYHYYFNLDNVKQKVGSVCRYFRRQLKNFISKKNYYVKEVKHKMKYIAYCMKDGEYESEGISEDELCEAEDYMETVKNDQKLSMSQKILNYVNEEHPEGIPTNEQVIVCILKLHMLWKKTPPYKAQMMRYVNHVLLQRGLDVNVIALQYL